MIVKRSSIRTKAQAYQLTELLQNRCCWVVLLSALALLAAKSGRRTLSMFGNVNGSFPDGFTSPNMTSAIALPPSCPGIKFTSKALISFAHGVSNAPGVAATTTCSSKLQQTDSDSDTQTATSKRTERSPVPLRRRELQHGQ